MVAGRYERASDGMAFERLGSFTDGVYAIALTLIVVGIGVPPLTDATDASELWSALGNHLAELISFAVGVVVIGFYWMSHHASYDLLGAVDRGYKVWTVLYLGSVAFLPYPIRLVGAYDDNPVSWALFAANLAVVSGLETVLFVVARRHGLLREVPTDAAYRWMVMMSTMPVPVFLLSIPVAFVFPWLALVVWATTAALQLIAERWRPADVPG